jgi:hypothetical protein
MSNKYIFEIGGAIGLIGSLIFVGIEINQNTAAVRGATQQEVSYQISEFYKIGIENERMAYITYQAMNGKISKNDLNETDYQRFLFLSMLGFRRVENVYLQYKNGFLDKVAFERIGMRFYRTNLVREIWEERREAFDPDFVEFFEKLRDNK